MKLPTGDRTVSNIVGTIRSFLTEPIWTGCFGAGLKWSTNFQRSPELIELRRNAIKDYRSAFDKDESVAEFLTSIFEEEHSQPIKNLVSAMLHGIYGGDVFKLSAKQTIFDRFWWHTKFPQHKGLLWMAKKEFYLQYDIVDGPNGPKVIEFAEKARNHNLLAFEDGLVTLVDELTKDLVGRENVTIQYDTPVTALEHKKDGQVLVCHALLFESCHRRTDIPQ